MFDSISKRKFKKISFLSIIVLVMGGTIGAGIFFKNKTISEMAQGHFGIVLATWGVGILAMLALAFALIEVSSAQKTNKGTLEWVKLFCPRWFSNTSSNYIKFIFVPITMFTLPLYFVNSLEDAGLHFGGEYVALLIAFAVFMWFMIINFWSLKIGEVSQWIFTLIKMIPLIALPIYGFINSGEIDHGTIMNKDLDPKNGLIGLSPWIAIIGGISAIAFAYDGFYSAASLRNEMEKPKRIGFGLVGGIIGISIVYLFLTIGFNVAGDGQLNGMQKFMSSNVYKMFNGFIAIGIIGIVNSYAMSSPYQFRDSSFAGEAPEIVMLQKIIYKDNYVKNDKHQGFISSWTFIVITTTILFLILGLIGGYAYNDTYGNQYSGGHLYQFSDVITNFTSLLIFLILTSAVLGAAINRITKKIKVIKSKGFLISAFISILIIYSASLYMIIEAIVGMTGFRGADIKSNSINFVIFIIFILISLIPALYKEHKIKKISLKKIK